jgi:hypothetical protein
VIVNEPTIHPSIRPVVVTVVKDGTLLKATVRKVPNATTANNLVKFSVTQL